MTTHLVSKIVDEAPWVATSTKTVDIRLTHGDNSLSAFVHCDHLEHLERQVSEMLDNIRTAIAHNHANREVTDESSSF